ncbi:thiosulfate sulfurtransferase/rhodanese-like domain-containing protein 3 [Micropterus salmoides]|uniref:thiosulfate sulfurtransferase/rhodanese-like domain-containing protein 3 n=1 Tax=Micropterus salmoides TaxID=27706 RepID=UPI0018EBFC1A|nr:thiosulfate sulfurtransferase/rhodanese-like domain-containing protein 3 [Micropterus salmoides]XP_045901088.1 thiosulfate sulfurtransferase/rhodanese-like domain-containing protein 3 [Micropterus dolomieu]
MALRRCWGVAGVVPRLLWNSSVLPGASVPGGRSSVSQPHCKKFLLRGFSSAPPSTDVGYEQLKQLLASRKAIIIDVREPWELREYGFIPGSINVPLGQVNTALQLRPEEFQEKYGGEMPQQTDNVVFTCLAGIRSKNALTAAASLGYKDVHHYPGGWQDWVKNEQHN